MHDFGEKFAHINYFYYLCRKFECYEQNLCLFHCDYTMRRNGCRMQSEE